MAQQLGQVAVGSIVKINESGSPVEFYVAKHDYESGLNGAGRTLVVRKDGYNKRQWNNVSYHTWGNCTLHSWLNNTYKKKLDSDIKEAMSTTVYYYTDATDPHYPVITRSDSVFQLSMTELGGTFAQAKTEGSVLPIASTLKIASYNGSPVIQWTRTPPQTYEYFVVVMDTYGNAGNGYVTDGNSVSRPAFTLPSNLIVGDSGSIITTLDAPSFEDVPIMVMQGNPIDISWTDIDGAASYILERKANTDSDWVQVYSGSNLSFSENSGNWSSVQYRVKSDTSGIYSTYTTSNIIEVIEAVTIAISGSDGDLGTLVNDVSYVVSSDGTTALTVVETINGVERTFTATNGATNKISVVDLATGTGTITIQASTNPGSGDVTVTREWTYTKTAPTFAEQGGLAQLTQQGQNIWAKTIAEAVRTPGIWGGNLGLALSKLAGAVLYNANQTAMYAEITVSLAGKSEGDTIRLPENGTMVDFYIGKLDYESGLNGAGRVLLVRKNCYDSQVWDAGGVNAYATSDIDAWFSEDYKAMFPSEIQTAMGATKIYYTPGNGNNTVTTLERSIFALSATELGKAADWINAEGTALPIASVLQISYLNGAAVAQWTRSPATNSTGNAIRLLANGGTNSNVCGSENGIRPAFTLPSNFTYGPVLVADDGTIHDSQEYKEAGTFTDISGGAIPMVSIETGSYVGTGTNGPNNPTTLTFNSNVKLVLVGTDGGYWWNLFLIDILDEEYKGNAYSLLNGESGDNLFAKYSQGTLSWYYNNSSSGYASQQCNHAGNTYHYVAIGVGGEST